MEIAVTTPTGNVGHFVVGNLIRAGVRPRILTRDVGTVEPEVRAHVDAVAVDLTDARAVREATRGVEALYAVAPATETEDPTAAYARIGAGFATAVAENGIARTVFQSSVGAELRQGAGEIDGLAAAEQALDDVAARAGVGVTHLRCGFFFTNLLLQSDAVAAGVVPILWPTDHRLAWVAPRDVADVATGLLLRPDWSGRRVQAVHGPQDLSWDEATAVVGDVVGRDVRAERIRDDEMRAALASVGMGPGQVEAIVGMAIGLRDGFVPEQSRDVTTTTPTTLASWAYDVLRPVLVAA
jgi:uncharacterized protein YbjT (DUF2867 family)